MEINFRSSGPELWGGIECTINRIGNVFRDQLADANYYHREDDIETIVGLGFKRFRYPVLWERHQPGKGGHINWDRAATDLNLLRRKGIVPIVGLLHHGSGPAHTDLLDDDFPAKFADYAAAVASRFPWLEYYTPINEPLTTARFSGLYGFWYPHHQNDNSFLKMLLNQLKATVLAMQQIRAVNPHAKLVQTEDLAKTHSTPLLAYQAVFENYRRWLTYDLLCGKVDQNHYLWPYFISEGITEPELSFFIANTCPPSVIGCNYYLTSERYLDECLDNYPASTHGGNSRHQYADTAGVRCNHRSGLKILLDEVWERYRIPVAVTECHLNCTREEQLRWLMETWETCCDLKANHIPVIAVTAWSLLGAHDWNSLLVTRNGHYETGAYDVQGGYLRATALARMIKMLATGQPFDHPLLQQPGWWRRIHEPGNVNGRPLLVIDDFLFAQACAERGIPFLCLSVAEFERTCMMHAAQWLQQTNPWGLVIPGQQFLRTQELLTVAPHLPLMVVMNGSNRPGPEWMDEPGVLVVQNKSANGMKFVHNAMDLFIDEEKGLWIFFENQMKKTRIRKTDFSPVK